MRHLLPVALLFSLGQPVFPALANEATPAVAASIPLDYRAAQQRLLERSDAIGAEHANVRSAEARAGAVRTLRRPDLDVEAQLLDYQKTLYLPLGSLAPIAADYGIPDTLRFKTDRTALRPIISATLPIYAGGQISATQKGAKAQLRQAEAERAGAVEDQLLQLTKAYFGQQLAEQALAVRRDVLQGLERHVADAKKLEQERFISRAERLQAEVARDDAARAYTQALSDLATANAVLAGMLHAPSGVRPLSPLAVNKAPLAPLESFKSAAFDNHPDLHRLRALGSQADAAVELERAKLRPTVYGFGQYNFDRRNTLLTDPDWTVGVGVKYKIFGGAGRQQMVESARQTAARAEAGVREAHTQIEIGITKYWHEAEAARKRWLLLDSSIALAEENLRLQTLSYREQQVTTLDIVNAELGLGKARIERAAAANDYIQATALLFSTSRQMERLPDHLDPDHTDKVNP